MELNEFISGTLQSIITAINESKDFAESNGAIINPIIMEHNFNANPTIFRKDGKDGKLSLTKIDFDIAVTVSNEEGSKVGGGIKIQVLNLGASSTNTETNQTTSRIKFSINVALPHQGEK